jgi:integrase
VAANESPTLGLSHLQFEALLTAARDSDNRFDFALVAMLGLLGLRIFEACHADIADVSQEHGHRVLRVVGKGSKVALVPLPPAVGRAIDRAIDDRQQGPPARTDPAQPTRAPDEPVLCDSPATAPRGGISGAAVADAPIHAAAHVRDHQLSERSCICRIIRRFVWTLPTWGSRSRAVLWGGPELGRHAL